MEGLVQFAQKVVKAVSKISPFPISLSDDEGYIIGDTNPERIGTFHLPSREVLDIDDLVLFDEEKINNMDNVLPGIAVPLQFDYKTVGVLGIIGDPEKVEPYALLVKNYVEMLWHETYVNQIHDLEVTTLEMFIQYVLLNNHLDQTKVDYYCKLLRIPVNRKRISIVVDIGDSLLKNAEKTLTITSLKDKLLQCCKDAFVGENEVCTFINTERMVLLKSVFTDNDEIHFMNSFQKQSEYLIQLFNKHHISKTAIAYGQLSTSIHDLHLSYLDADYLLQIGHEINIQPKIYHYSNWEVLSTLFLKQIDQNYRSKIDKVFSTLQHQEDFHELANNFIGYCENNLNISQTAKKLFIHRNTLIYRLNKISRLINIDIKNFEQCTILYFYLRKSLEEKQSHIYKQL